MKWKDSTENGNRLKETNQDYLDDETYSPWGKGASGTLISNWSRKPTVPYILAVIGVIVLVVALASIFSGSGGGSGAAELRALEERIGQLEDQLAKAELLFQDGSRLDDLESKNEQLKGRLDRMEAALALRMDHLSKSLESLKTRSSAAAPKKTVQKAPEKPAEKSAPEKTQTPQNRYYTVSAGDTLYSISRRNGITVDQLLKMNNLAPGESIYPGQKLLVGR